MEFWGVFDFASTVSPNLSLRVGTVDRGVHSCIESRLSVYTCTSIVQTRGVHSCIESRLSVYTCLLCP